MQSFEVHIAYNFLMDYYQNEEIVRRQKKIIERSLVNGEKLQSLLVTMHAANRYHCIL